MGNQEPNSFLQGFGTEVIMEACSKYIHPVGEGVVLQILSRHHSNRMVQEPHQILQKQLCWMESHGVGISTNRKLDSLENREWKGC